ncbi:pathway-specific nitrogen regulator [Byssothecium circinans]|uniref:Pathway-specific nitrogen regulator n=1 Tax=Byssothecium circinans TaxID=147558 RepID=A0A6A5T717_9PLEO|nr:pathway-specific nitrogen regulator [Byssothecium circinans]
MDISSGIPNRAIQQQPQQRQADAPKGRRKSRKEGEDGAKKRRCISSACVPCRKRKSKCDGTTPACSACAAVYNTPCVYDPNSDHRRKGVYKKDIDNLKTRNSTLQTLIQAILNYPEEEVGALVQQIRTCESLDAVADAIIAKENGEEEEEEPLDPDEAWDDGTAADLAGKGDKGAKMTFENQLSGKMGELRLDHGSTRYIGGTSHLIYLGAGNEGNDSPASLANVEPYAEQLNPLITWTKVTSDPELVQHLIGMYFCWHYSFFTTLSRSLFMKEFQLGKPPPGSHRKLSYCTPLLVNAMLALGCHFTSHPGARAVRDDSATAGDHFFKEAKRLILEDDLHEVPALTTVQALALMSVREAGCGREAKGWVYSGMSFRMACDLGLNLGMGRGGGSEMGEVEEDARRITFWGCFLFDKCWSNYLGRLPQLPSTIVTVPKFEVFPEEDAATWSAYTDSGISQAHSQPSRTRAVALQISKLCEISSDLMNYFYNPIDMDKARGKQTELKKLSELHQRLETWRRELPKELEPKEGGLPSMLVMHMFFQLLFIHLFRPFLKYNPNNSPLPAHISPRKLCTQAAAMISKLLRLYKRSHGLRQICNIVVYIAHSACTIHLLNLPDKNARRDIVHGVKHLEEIAESWLCARRTLGILSTLVKKWKVELPDEAKVVLERTDGKFGPWETVTTPRPTKREPQPIEEQQQQQQQISPVLQPYSMSLANTATQFFQRGPGEVATLSGGQGHIPQTDEARSLPPNDASSLAYSYLQNQQHAASPQNTGTQTNNVATPASTQARQSIDGTPNSTGNSPSQLFGGVEQLMREGQDWWLRDQNQLAIGFDNWGYGGGDDLANWFAGQGQGGAVASPGSGNFATGAVGNGGVGVDAAMNGGAVGANPNGNGNSNANGGGLNGFGGYNGQGGLYNESEWYQ